MLQQLPGAVEAGSMGGSLTNSRTAKLILIQPRNFQMQAKRPLVYNFDGNMMQRTYDAVNAASISGDKVLLDRFLSDPTMLGSVRTSANATYYVAADRLSYLWTFMLIIDNDPMPGQQGPSNLHQNRTIYYGICQDEPINPIAHLGQYSVNESANLLITHKTLISGQNNFGSGGFGSRMTTTVDNDIFNPRYAQTLSSLTETALIRPEDLSTYSIVDASKNTMKLLGEKKMVMSMHDPLQIANSLSVPKQNLKHIMGGIIGAYSSAQYNTISGMDTGPGFSEEEDLQSAVAANLQSNSVLQRIGLSERELLSIATIRQRYQPEVIQIDPTENMNHGLVDQSGITPSNCFSSMLMSIVPHIIADMGLGHLGFVYDSHRPGQPYFNAYGSFAPLNDMELIQRARLTVDRLQKEVFPILQSGHGEFYMTGLFCVGGISRCNIKFHDDALHNNDWFEVPHVLGGLTNNLWADADTATANSLEYNNLLGMLCDSGNASPGPLTINAESSLQNSVANAYSQNSTVGSTFGGYQPEDSLRAAFSARLDDEEIY